MKDLIESLLPSTPMFIADLVSNNVISLDERDTIDMEPCDAAKLNTLIAVLKTKKSAWNVATEFLAKNNQTQLAETLNNSAVQSNLHQPDLQLGETETNPSDTSTMTVKNSKGLLVKFADYISGSRLAIGYKSILKSLSKRSEDDESTTPLLPDVVSLKQIYPTESKVQLKCMRLIKNFLLQNPSELTVDSKSNLLETMLTCLQSDFNNESIVDCCTDLLAKLEIFSDPIDKYTKTVKILLKIISNPDMTTETKRSTIWLLTQIVLKSDENRRNLIGQMDRVGQICELISQQLNNPTYDRILAFSWICLDNLCFSLLNKKKFLSAGGVDLFHLCYEKFGDEAEMVEKLMGIMLNLSCFSPVRPQVLSKRNFNVFWEISLNFKDNVVVSWRCAAIFSSFLSDSTTIWPLDSPTVEEAKNLLIETINKWKLDAQTNVGWSTFEPLLNELKVHKSPLNDLIWTWTIANLTTVDASKYCRMLSEEGGVEILTSEVIWRWNSSIDAVMLAKKAIDNIDSWTKSTDQH